jgi:hypothetical protein
MKTPCIEDFDPKAIPKLSSPMDDLPTIEKSPLSQVVFDHAEEIRPQAASRPASDTAERPVKSILTIASPQAYNQV